MKFVYVILVILLIPTIMAVGYGQESIIKSSIKVTWDRQGSDEAIIRIQGENLDWSKTIKYNKSTISNESSEIVGLSGTWIENIELLMIRKLGNYTDVQYAIIECNQMANFSKEWRDCIDLNLELDLMMLNEMINKTIYEDDVGNLTLQRDDWKSRYEKDTETKDNKIADLTEEKDKLLKHRRYGWILGVVGIVAAGWTFYKYRGFGKRERQEEGELPTDHSA